MKRSLLVLVVLIACEGKVEEEAAAPEKAEAKLVAQDQPGDVPDSDSSKTAAATPSDISAWGDEPPYTPERAGREGWFTSKRTIGGVEVFSRRGKPPPLELSKEAEGYLKKHGGWLTWSPDAPEGGSWMWEPRERGCGVFMQGDQVANTAIVLAGVSLEAHCRLCAERRRGRWKWRGCTCEEHGELEDIYKETENRLNRDGIRDRFTGFYDVQECEQFRDEMEELEATLRAGRKKRK